MDSKRKMSINEGETDKASKDLNEDFMQFLSNPAEIEVDDEDFDDKGQNVDEQDFQSIQHSDTPPLENISPAHPSQ